MKITLEQLTLVNFQGMRNFVFQANGGNTDAFGDNGTGKTTLFTAFTWVLFDKDSQNKKDFSIKTLDENGNVIHGLDHEVEAVLNIDGRVLTLRKVFKEKWTKQRGSATAEFTGHTTDYYIDGVPVKQKEYKDRIDSIIGEDIFKLLTSPTYFNEVLDWKTRRKTLLEIAGDLSDEEVIASSPSLRELSSILNGRSIDDHRKVIAAERARINKELETIPIRIDEAERSKPDIEGLDESDLRSNIDVLNTKVDVAQAELNRLQTGGEVAEKEKRLREIEAELLQIRNNAQSDIMVQITAQRKTLSDLEGEVDATSRQIERKTSAIAINQESIQELEAKVIKLRENWITENSTELAETGVVDTCPTCGQALPENEVEAANQKAMAHFNQHKAEKLESITADAQKAKARISELEQANQQLQSEIESLDSRLKQQQRSVTDAKTELEKLQAQVTDPTKSLEYRAKEMERQAVTTKIASLRQSVLDDVERVRNELMDLRDELRRKESLLARFDQVSNLDERIAELSQQERKLASEYERLEKELYLTEEFIRTKVNLLENRINSKFRYARFKLFDTQINGGLAETCETLYNGVPYGTGLNNAARINVGLDIINTLSEHYGILAPIFIDNRESVTKLIDCDSQVISLIVSEKDKQLRVVTDSERVKEAV